MLRLSLTCTAGLSLALFAMSSSSIAKTNQDAFCQRLQSLAVEAASQFDRVRGAQTDERPHRRQFKFNGPVEPFSSCKLHEKTIGAERTQSALCSLPDDDQEFGVAVSAAHRNSLLTKTLGIVRQMAACFNGEPSKTFTSASVETDAMDHNWEWHLTVSRADKQPAKVEATLFASIPDVGSESDPFYNPYMAMVEIETKSKLPDAKPAALSSAQWCEAMKKLTFVDTPAQFKQLRGAVDEWNAYRVFAANAAPFGDNSCKVYEARKSTADTVMSCELASVEIPVQSRDEVKDELLPHIVLYKTELTECLRASEPKYSTEDKKDEMVHRWEWILGDGAAAGARRPKVTLYATIPKPTGSDKAPFLSTVRFEMARP